MLSCIGDVPCSTLLCSPVFLQQAAKCSPSLPSFRLPRRPLRSAAASQQTPSASPSSEAASNERHRHQQPACCSAAPQTERHRRSRSRRRRDCVRGGREGGRVGGRGDGRERSLQPPMPPPRGARRARAPATPWPLHPPPFHSLSVLHYTCCLVRRTLLHGGGSLSTLSELLHERIRFNINSAVRDLLVKGHLLEATHANGLVHRVRLHSTSSESPHAEHARYGFWNTRTLCSPQRPRQPASKSETGAGGRVAALPLPRTPRRRERKRGGLQRDIPSAVVISAPSSPIPPFAATDDLEAARREFVGCGSVS